MLIIFVSDCEPYRRKMTQSSRSVANSETRRSLIVASLGGFFFFASYGILMGALPAELSSRNFGPSYIGLVVGFHALGAVSFRILLPTAVDRSGARKVSLVAAIIGALSSLTLGISIIAFDAALPLLAAANFVHGATTSAFLISGYAYVAQAGELQRRGTRIGVYGSVGSLGLLVPPPIGIWLWSLGVDVYLWLLPVALMLPAILLLPGDQRRASAEMGTEDLEGSFTLLFGSIVLAPVLALAVTAGMQGGFEAHMPFLVRAFDAQAIIVLLYAFFGVSVAAGRLGGGWLADRRGAKLVFFSGLAFQMLALLLPLTAPTANGLLSSAIMFGVGSGMVGTAAIALLVQAVPAHRSGSAIGLGAMLRDAGFAAGAAATGVVIAIGGARGFLLTGFALTGVAIAIAAFVYRSKGETVPSQ